MGLKSIFAVVPLTFLAAACTPTYVSPLSGPMAEVSLSRAQLLEAQQAKLMVTDREGRGRADITGGLLFTYDQPTRIPAGVPIHLEVQILHYGGTTDFYCGYRFVFVPASERSYRVTPRAPAVRMTPVGPQLPECDATVVDRETGQEAPSLAVIPIGPGWRPAD